MIEYHTGKSEWTVSFSTGKSIAFMHKLQECKEEWREQYLDGDRDDPHDEDSDWVASIDVHSVAELFDLLVLLRDDNARDISIQATVADAAAGVKCWVCLQEYGDTIATVEIAERDATRSARIENAAKRCVASLNKAMQSHNSVDKAATDA